MSPAAHDAEPPGRREREGAPDEFVRDHDTPSPGAYRSCTARLAHSQHVACVITSQNYDYLMGGKDNYLPDREAGDQLIKAAPSIRDSVRQNRWFMHRAVRYVDNDPIVIAHMYARLTSSPAGRVGYLHTDMREAKQIRTAPELTAVLDLGQPVALLILLALHELPNADEARAVLHRYVAALAPGSFLALSVATYEGYSRAVQKERDSVLSELSQSPALAALRLPGAATLVSFPS